MNKKELMQYHVRCCRGCKHSPQQHSIYKMPVFRNVFVWYCNECSCHDQFSLERKPRPEKTRVWPEGW